MKNGHSQLWPYDWRQLWIIIATIAASLFIHFIWHLQSGEYFGTLIMMTWAFVWLPVLISYCFSAINKCYEFSRETGTNNFDVNTFQRCGALLLAGVLNISISHLIADSETAGWILLIYLVAVLPVQIMMIFVFDTLLFLVRKYCHKYSQGNE